MSVRIQLDKPHAHFTNLDLISGIVILSITGNETISLITVKLEGESRTRLAGPTNPRGTYDPYERDQAQLEVHKLLYQTQTVFPTQELLRASGGSGNYTLPGNTYRYPFQFKIRLNNDCSNNNSVLTNLSPLRLEMARNTDRHVKKTLPPTLSGLPGEAEIRYYVKATVQRPAFYKENFRAIAPFTFLPIEPPRPPANKREFYARRSHQFSPSIEVPGRPGLFRQPSMPTGPSASTVLPPNISIDGRLPDPPIITCNEPLPLRILITKKNDSPAKIYLQILSINLIAFTTVRAHELRREEVSSWTILSSANMRTPLNEVVGSDGSRVLEVDSRLWKQRTLPNTICPSFETCNIMRKYVLEVKVGLQWGSPNINPELSVQPLRIAVEVYSGIAPPQALLDQLHRRPTGQAPYMASNLRPPGVVNGPPPQSPRPPVQQGPSDHIEPSPGDIPDEAPPSYEDAMADDLGPIDGPRRQYEQQPSQTPIGDEKRSGNDRLFP
ncbi:hypothetical protein JMJ35_008463 [Cladonia borealis]|uniref:Arrestin-like N-terminal domain-containing protein n=1 Tax=Cladonia borealis TaxID=184061 RepID=A0AA39QTS4_9LECA|nr:hypothetical protein JMJ35_008463 [Cladonia borealis]